MPSNPSMNHPQSPPSNYIASGSQPRGSQTPQSSGRGGNGGDAQGPVAIGGTGGGVDFEGAPLPRLSAAVPRSEEPKLAIGGGGGRVTLPDAWRGECDIGKRDNADLRVFFIPPD
ncbi:hypothetical protein BS47DRAFT_1365622 [Hydnum rufescens UP504]|uniref:Uncharacterized protein n=1 Tax=Hydnum rufescens UP504 TaxID=1448309 RepID=A0A9P6AN56_9AGAM|nr:hypothetical protein BS47DRAFT_1365622 [Hydnum rufescens UP504]